MNESKLLNLVCIDDDKTVIDLRAIDNTNVIRLTEGEVCPKVKGITVLLTSLNWVESRSDKQHQQLLDLAQTTNFWLAILEEEPNDETLIKWLSLGVTDAIGKDKLSIWCQQVNIVEYINDKNNLLWILESTSGHCNTAFQNTLISAGFDVHIFNSLDDLPTNHLPSLIICCDLGGIVIAKSYFNRTGKSVSVLNIVDTSLPQQTTLTQAQCIPSSIAPDQLTTLIRKKIMANDVTNTCDLSFYSDQMIHALDQHAIVSATDTRGIITHINNKFSEISGYSRDELLGRNHSMLKSGLHGPEFYKDMWSTLGKGNPWHGTICNKNKLGDYYWVEATIIPNISYSGEVIGYCSVRTDITALKEKEETLRKYGEMLRQSQIFANVGTWDWNIITGELYWSERIAPLFGYDRGEVETSYENFINAVHPEDRANVQQAISQSIEHDSLYSIEHRVIWENGDVRWLLEQGAATRDASGAPSHMLGVVQDIHERKMAELALAASEAKLADANMMIQQVLNTIPDRVFWKDRNLKYLGGNQAFCTDAGLNSPKELIGLTDLDMPWADKEATQYQSDDLSVIKNDKPMLNFEERQTLTSGVQSVLRTSKIPLKGINGEIIGLLGVYQDVTEAVDIQQRLKDNEERLKFAVEGAGDGVWDWDIQSGYMKFSRLYMKMLGYEEFELPHHQDTWTDSVHPEDKEYIVQYLSEFFNDLHDSYKIQLRLRCKDGSYKWILCRGTLVKRSKSGEPLRMIGIHSDITEQKTSEESLSLLRKVFDSSEQCIVVADEQYNVVFENQAHKKAYGISEGNTTNGDFLSLIAKDQKTKDLVMHTLIDKKLPWSGITTRSRSDGSEFVSINNFGVITSSVGAVSNLFVIYSDFTEEINRREELAIAKDEAEQANGAKSDFLSSMSHELRTPMNSVIGFAQLLEHDENMNPDQQDNVNEILKAGRHLLDLINEILDLAKIESGKINLSMEPVDISSLIQECYDLTNPLAANRQLSFNIKIPSALYVQADRIRLKQVLLNLISNGIKYNSDKGDISVYTEAINKNIRIFVSDTGPGIPEERLTELYQPFNRLDANTTDIEGTGIGLSITQKLIKIMNGDIGVDSQVGQGTVFWIELPVTKAPLEHIDDLDNEAEALIVDENIKQHLVLCIDDNPANLKLIIQILSKIKNVKVMTALEPQLGLDMARLHVPDLILLDINMPHMDGYEVLRQLLMDNRAKHIPVVAVTANAMPIDIKRGLAAGFDDYMTKPLNLEQTIAMVKKYIERTNR